MLRTGLVGALIVVGLFAYPGCNEDPMGGDPDPDPGQELDLALCSPSSGGFTTSSTNPYFPLVVGSELILEGEEDGATIRVEIRVLDEIELVAGVDTRVVEERETEDGELIEVSRNFFAQAADGTLCYFGENVDFFEDGEVVSHEGAWRADGAGNRPGIIRNRMPG